MKTNKPLTVGQFIRWCEDNNVSKNTPIGIYFGDMEIADLTLGVVGDTECEIDDDDNIINMSETTGEHCFISNYNNIFEETNNKQIVFLTNGQHEEAR